MLEQWQWGASAQVSGGASALKAAFEFAQAAMAEESGSGSGGGSGGVFGGGEDTGSVDTLEAKPQAVTVVRLQVAVQVAPAE